MRLERATGLYIYFQYKKWFLVVLVGYQWIKQSKKLSRKIHKQLVTQKDLVPKQMLLKSIISLQMTVPTPWDSSDQWYPRKTITRRTTRDKRDTLQYVKGNLEKFIWVYIWDFVLHFNRSHTVWWSYSWHRRC